MPHASKTTALLTLLAMLLHILPLLALTTAAALSPEDKDHPLTALLWGRTPAHRRPRNNAFAGLCAAGTMLLLAAAAVNTAQAARSGWTALFTALGLAEGACAYAWFHLTNARLRRDGGEPSSTDPVSGPCHGDGDIPTA
ncbi:hypothetical protein ACFU5O_32025 [Streptomyces sp. NPDC057445]|uniref:hypothetical protein n=1 Tax=Streptomyces sp. NPDC057445 TaxID=3346136 RepID=UPI00368871ED